MIATAPVVGTLDAAAQEQESRAEAHPEKAVCRVCAARSTHGADPEPEAVAGVSYYDGEPYYFCSDECQKEFDQSPAWWAPLQLPFPVPELQVRQLDGQVAALPLAEGELTVLDFWATWCRPCKQTMQGLQERFEQQQNTTASDLSVRILGISIDEGAKALDQVRRFTEKHGITYPIFLDDQSNPAWTALKIYAVPTILLVDRQGNVVWRFTGPEGHERLDEMLATLEPEQR